MVENSITEWQASGIESTQENDELAILSLLLSAVLWNLEFSFDHLTDSVAL